MCQIAERKSFLVQIIHLKLTFLSHRHQKLLLVANQVQGDTFII